MYLVITLQSVKQIAKELCVEVVDEFCQEMSHALKLLVELTQETFISIFKEGSLEMIRYASKNFWK